MAKSQTGSDSLHRTIHDEYDEENHCNLHNKQKLINYFLELLIVMGNFLSIQMDNINIDGKNWLDFCIKLKFMYPIEWVTAWMNCVFANYLNLTVSLCNFDSTALLREAQ